MSVVCAPMPIKPIKPIKPIVCIPVKPLSVYKTVNYRSVGAPCRFINSKCKVNGVCGIKYNKWGMCDRCGVWKRVNRVDFDNNV